MTCDHVLCEFRYQGTQSIFCYEGCCPSRANPPASALVRFGPGSPLPPDEKGEDHDLAGERSAEGPVLLGISVLANGPGADDAADPGFFVGFPSGGFGWLQTSVIPRAPWQGFDWNAVSFVRSTKEILGRCIPLEVWRRAMSVK